MSNSVLRRHPLTSRLCFPQVFVQLQISVQYQVIKEQVYDAYYK